MSKERKQRGILATPTGKQKLQEAKANGRNELGRLLTYDNIAEKAGVDKRTVERFMRRLQLIDRDNALAICQALGLEITDVVDPDEWNCDESSNTEINWTEICQQALINKPLRRFATDEPCELQIFVPLGLVERKKQQRRPLNQEMERNQVYEVEEKEEITRRFEHEEFLNYIGLGTTQGESDKNIAIIGEPGAGKTTLLQNLALIISDQQKGLPICVSLGALSKERSLIGYLEETWLRDGLAVGEVKESDKADFRQLFDKGQVWLILDGLDEYSADSPVEALTWIENEVRSSYLQKARVVVSCRVNVWDAHLTNPLQGFIPYKTLDFTEYQHNQFIKEWFEYKHNSDLGKSLINRLQDSGRESLRELVKNPLRLVVLCQIWSLGRGDLPETKAQLYQVYLPYFYDWKKEVRDLTQDDHLQASLHQALGKLAIAGIESVSRYRLPRKLAVEVMGQELFKLAVTLGWLNIVDRDIVTQEAVYAFFHPTFQEFFAACGVEDWDFFLPRNHVDRPVKGKVYRIFEAKWKEVILLWLGRGDVKDEEKEAFIKGLVDFKDGCGESNWKTNRGFYECQAFFLSAYAIQEFSRCKLADKIFKETPDKIFKETLKFSINNPYSNLFVDEYIRKEYQDILKNDFLRRKNIIEICIDRLNPSNIHHYDPLYDFSTIIAAIAVNNQNVIEQIIEFAKETDNDHLKYIYLDEILDKIASYEICQRVRFEITNKEDEQAVRDFEKALQETNEPDRIEYLISFLWEFNVFQKGRMIDFAEISSKQYQLCEKVAYLLGEYVDNQKVIDTLLKTFYYSYPIEVVEAAGESLKKVAINNQSAIDYLIEIIESEGSTDYLAIDVLESIAYDNLKATKFIENYYLRQGEDYDE
ncbi:putative signal transduction protein with Nacht domain protein [Microcystis aeruginosa NIES-3804]|uniref:Putative signal transduction protein with Nacht domain protein n=1 Tax=Microcystis aeruginosa NIES-3804 TaxID=2517783 RepID=A0A6H9GMI2_MICAE|nr:helix-turn-helix domain-containing protein [Microcystis aeruginosa]GCL51249.1 putative signal transduction protein with Nacht domain protein [Microcystis aeruginosa NIES-3804]